MPQFTMVRGNATKRPTSAYGFFVKMCYEEHKKKYPNENVQVTEISKKCAEKWKTMTDPEKHRFFELAQKDTERYQAELAAYGQDGVRAQQMGRKKRQKKDPNAPKRALSAFFFFSQERRPQIQKDHPDWRVGQIAQELGNYWKQMTDEDKKPFEDMATRDRSRYEQAMQMYKAGGVVPPELMGSLLSMMNATTSAASLLASGAGLTNYSSIPQNTYTVQQQQQQQQAGAGIPPSSAVQQQQQQLPVPQQVVQLNSNVMMNMQQQQPTNGQIQMQVGAGSAPE